MAGCQARLHVGLLVLLVVPANPWNFAELPIEVRTNPVGISSTIDYRYY
jgi:hypothetical protein